MREFNKQNKEEILREKINAVMDAMHCRKYK